jgi:uncharacterized lipoprotein YddW (UPF0748 family)
MRNDGGMAGSGGGTLHFLMRSRSASICVLLLSLLLSRCSSTPQSDTPPPVEREFRGVWIATVANIDWPSRRDLGAEAQQQELARLFDLAKELGFNTIVLQVRPAGDALYASEIEPWSEYLTGEMGRAPEPFWDPLAFAVRQAHARGLELHAWFNPYRAHHPSGTSPIVDSHLSRTRPDLVKTYGRHLWMDPGEPEVRERTKSVILDVVRRYDVDGVHMDDYFYPYPEQDASGREIEFPDEASWERYRAGGGTLERAAWRRSNVDSLVRELYREVKAVDPHVKVGISPFGIWRPGHPESIAGFDAYERIYADSLLWLREGWLDYFAPQLYWPIGAKQQSFPVLLEWWKRQNSQNRMMVPGISVSRVATGRPNSIRSSEIVDQIRLSRKLEADGLIHYSIKALSQDRDGIGTKVRSLYSSPALPPAMTWIDDVAPAKPVVTVNGPAISWTGVDADEVRSWVVQVRSREGWTTSIEPADVREMQLRPGMDRVHVRAVDRAGNLSPSAIVTMTR